MEVQVYRVSNAVPELATQRCKVDMCFWRSDNVFRSRMHIKHKTYREKATCAEVRRKQS